MRNIKWIGVLAVAMSAVAFFTTAFQERAQGKQSFTAATCNEQNIAGAWIYAEFGTIHPNNPLGLPAGLYNAAGTLTLDGFGNYTVEVKEMWNGTLAEVSNTGTYVMDGCGVTFYADGFPIPVSFTYISGTHNEARGMSLLPGTNKTSLAVRK